MLHEIDIRDRRPSPSAFGRVAPEAIFHLAAQIDVRRSVADPPFDARVNIEGTINVLEAARAADVGRFVVSSTGGAIYGETDVLPSHETVEPLPEAPYGQSKYCAERYVRLYGRLFGLSGVSLRYGNVYGPASGPARRGGRRGHLLRQAARRRGGDRLRRRAPDARLRVRRRRRRARTWPPPRGRSSPAR